MICALVPLEDPTTNPPSIGLEGSEVLGTVNEPVTGCVRYNVAVAAEDTIPCTVLPLLSNDPDNHDPLIEVIVIVSGSVVLLNAVTVASASVVS